MEIEQKLNKDGVEHLNQKLTNLQVIFQVKKKGENSNLTEMKGTIAIENHIFSSGNSMDGFYDLFCYTEAGEFSVSLAKEDQVHIALHDNIIVIESKGYIYTLLIKQ